MQQSQKKTALVEKSSLKVSSSFGSKKEEVDHAKSLSSTSQDNLRLTEELELEKVLLKFPNYQDLDSVLDDSNDSDGSKTEPAASFATSQKDRQSEIKGNSTNREVNRPRLIGTKDHLEAKTQEVPPFLRQQTPVDSDERSH